MRCPVCKDDTLDSSELINSLNAHSCRTCDGTWIRFDEYRQWKNSSHGDNIQSNSTEEYVPIYDSKQANLCPDCGRILTKYKVSSNLNFNVDHCGYCNGVWLDKNEWAMLIQNNLHHQLYEFFTRPWQKKLREEISKQHMEKQYINRFGEDNYTKLKTLKEWIDSSGKKSEMLAFLLDDEPYKI